MILKQGYHIRLQHDLSVSKTSIGLLFKAACMQVGSELELMSKDERELAQSRAELAGAADSAAFSTGSHRAVSTIHLRCSG